MAPPSGRGPNLPPRIGGGKIGPGTPRGRTETTEAETRSTALRKLAERLSASLCAMTGTLNNISAAGTMTVARTTWET
jgi:hypothetical protein